jgi:hypothetical protein
MHICTLLALYITLVHMRRLVQNYVVCGLEHKLDVLHSFLKSHLKSKTIVFLSSCAQVLLLYDTSLALHVTHCLCIQHASHTHCSYFVRYVSVFIERV